MRILVPREVGSEEILVRYILAKDLKDKAKRVRENVIDKEIFLDTRGGVSLMRETFATPDLCFKKGSQNEHALVGFLCFKKEKFEELVEKHGDIRTNFKATIKGTPLDENSQIIPETVDVYTDTPANPAHADLEYIDPGMVNDESPKTAIRVFSRLLYKHSKSIFFAPDIHGILEDDLIKQLFV